ncbi:hypothetical protein BDV11DRAFT_200935 [Aspergillus similis]
MNAPYSIYILCSVASWSLLLLILLAKWRRFICFIAVLSLPCLDIFDMSCCQHSQDNLNPPWLYLLLAF